ncbi:DNA polymerase III subunit delta [Thalassolituus sp. UBA2590]|uniref:DNA polymerase III subunit delta n=1 Tax=Thalassolituus sp. UBA2590 TaxID=1947663 RepID=UPI002648ED5E|nr:DNA polymerase III subunit delta [Thalassolituus sp. UBA2590]MEC9255378.1 DNA polymerase III subunit delta [Pseudomonadota bacterium]|tara:strand:+ start:1163 stop:2179 length:1017 start_codon:yes stop_codon:yes gene_type:complete
MKLRQDQLGPHLAKELAPCYLISGDDPLLVMEACDDIRKAVKQQGIDERELFHAEAGFEWRTLREEASAMSLFSSRRLLELRIPNGKPSDKGETIKDLAEHPSPDNIVLIICPRLDAKTQKTAWYKAIEKHGVVLPIWPIERNQYPSWLKRRFQMAGLQADQAAVSALAHQTEGNLLAAVQEIEKLRMLGETNVSEELIMQSAGDSSRFDAFGLADACLMGKLGEANRMLGHLRSEGHEPIMVLGALTRKIRQLIALKPCQGAQALSEGFRSQGVWPRQQAPYKAALQRLSMKDLHRALSTAAEADLAAKGSGDDAWLKMGQIVIILSGQADKLFTLT